MRAIHPLYSLLVFQEQQPLLSVLAFCSHKRINADYAYRVASPSQSRAFISSLFQSELQFREKFFPARTLKEKSQGKISERIYTTVERMKNINKNEIKFHDIPLYASIFIFGDIMLVAPQLYGTRENKAPLMKIQNIHNEDSLFSSYSS